MKEFKKAQELFVDDLDIEGYFDSFSFESAKKKLLKLLHLGDTPLIFLFGESGAGKSFLLNYISENADAIKLLKFFRNPYFNDTQFLETLLESSDIEFNRGELSQEELIEKLRASFHDLENIIFIDEAQFLTTKQLEMIRMLGDLKVFRFVLAFHKEDAKEILKKAHFKTRTIASINIEPLQKSEIKRFIESRLIKNNLSEIAHMFNSSHVNFIYECSNANFRMMKKMLRAVCEIVATARKSKLHNYTKIDKTTLTMAAIDIGCIDVES